MLKIAIVIFFLIYCVSAIMYTIINKFNYLINILKQIAVSTKKKVNTINEKSHKRPVMLKNGLKKILYINSWIKFEILIWFIASAIISILKIKDENNSFINGLAIVSIIIFFRGIAIFISYRDKHSEAFLDRVYSYLIKMMIFISYSSLFFIGFLQKLNSNILFILAIFMLLIYSICFLKYVIDEWKSFTFLMVNLISIYIYDLVIFGFTFGFFYLSRNDIYGLFESVESLSKLNTANSYAIIINRGLSYFYTYSNIVKAEDLFNSCVPFLQYLFGVTFNVAIIGFFISYTASKAFSKNENTNSNLLDQIKNKKFRVTVKKEDL